MALVDKSSRLFSWYGKCLFLKIEFPENDNTRDESDEYDSIKQAHQTHSDKSIHRPIMMANPKNPYASEDAENALKYCLDFS
jgi:hypothetical protein